MIRFTAQGRKACAHADEPLTTDSAGIAVAVDLSGEYDGLAATLVFEAGDASADVPLMGQAVTVPPDVLAEPGARLYMGVWASDAGGTVVIPTVWAHVGTVTEGTRPSGVEPVGPAPSWAAQVQQAAADAVATANSVRADADAGAFDGEDGYSPTATVTQGDGSATISITDKDGTTTATVHDGTDGRDGRDGTDGVDGFSPTATVTQAASGATISITDKSGTTTASVSNGTDGTDGTDGADGFSPTVDVQAITGGHEVTITDADGAHSFDVMDGDPAAPGSVTDAMLAPDGIKPQVGQLWGNQLTGEVAGTIATASDAYAAPPMALVVDGRSTQVTTTGKNLLSNVAEDWTLTALDGTSYRCCFVSVTDGASYYYHREAGNTSLAAGWTDGADGSGFTAIASMSGHNDGYAFSNSDNHSYLVFYFASSVTAEVAAEAMSGGNVQVEAGSSFTTYEPYTGGKPSPSPDHQQGITSVDAPVLMLAGKQLMDWEHPFRTGSYSYDIAIGTTIAQGSSENVGVSLDGGILTMEITSTWTGAIWRSPDLPNGPYRIYLPTATVTGGSGSSYGSTLFVVDKSNKVVRKIGTHASTGNWTSPITLEGDEVAICVNAGTRSSTSGKTFAYEGPQLEVGSVQTAYEPYQGTTIPLYDGTLRSLPDGTKDELSLAYLRPSTREGWAWYSREVVQRIGSLLFSDISWTYRAAGVDPTGQSQSRFTARFNAVGIVAGIRPTNSFCTAYAVQSSSGDRQTIFPDGSIYQLTGYDARYQNGVTDSRFDNVADFLAANVNTEITARLINPVTTQLDPIELPALPAPNCTVWCDPATGLALGYVQDTNIVIAELRAALADLATS